MARPSPASFLADPRRANQARRERQVLVIHHQPAGQQLLEDLLLPDPLRFSGVRLRQVQPPPPAPAPTAAGSSATSGVHLGARFDDFRSLIKHFPQSGPPPEAAVDISASARRRHRCFGPELYPRPGAKKARGLPHLPHRWHPEHLPEAGRQSRPSRVVRPHRPHKARARQGSDRASGDDDDRFDFRVAGPERASPATYRSRRSLWTV